MTTSTQPAGSDLVTLTFGSEADAELAAAGASWAMGEPALVERAGTTVRARVAGAADRVARFIIDLDAAGIPVGRIEVTSAPSF
jgi:hypothetical protein